MVNKQQTTKAKEKIKVLSVANQSNSNSQKLKDTSKEFLLDFFKNCKISEENGILNVSEVPTDFEEFVGKKAPYKFVFDINLHDKILDSELIMQGSYFLVAIKDYLRDKGQTSLLKMDVTDMSKDFKLKKLTSKKGLIYEFSFLSTYQYLNNKKQSITKILVADGKVIEADLSKIKTQKGVKDDILEIDATGNYEVAKKLLDEKVKGEVGSIKKILKDKLEKELLRVKDHYLKQIKEKDEEVESCANKIKMLQGKLRHTSYERDVNILIRLIRESRERLEMLKKKSYKERLLVEEKFHINDEVEKHVLSIKNVLINVSVYYW